MPMRHGHPGTSLTRLYFSLNQRSQSGQSALVMRPAAQFLVRTPLGAQPQKAAGE